MRARSHSPRVTMPAPPNSRPLRDTSYRIWPVSRPAAAFSNVQDKEASKHVQQTEDRDRESIHPSFFDISQNSEAAGKNTVLRTATRPTTHVFLIMTNLAARGSVGKKESRLSCACRGPHPTLLYIFAIFLQAAIVEFLLFDKLENCHASTGRIIWSTLFTPRLDRCACGNYYRTFPRLARVLASSELVLGWMWKEFV